MSVFKRLIPKTVIGMVALVLVFSIGASLSGVGFYAFYQYQQHQTETKVNNYIGGFDERFRTASDTIDAEKQNAQASIQNELKPALQAAAGGSSINAVVDKVRASTWFLQTLDNTGAPSVGTAFAVQSDANTTLMITSFTAIQAATVTPAPTITVTKGNDKVEAKLLNWVESQDLAVISVPRGNIAVLGFVAKSAEPKLGDRTFVVSGLGSAGASATQGLVDDVSTGVIMQDAPIGVAFRGAPLVNNEGAVTGVASLNYAPLGFQSSTGVTFAIPIRDTCKTLLTCPSDLNSVSSAQAR